MNQTRALKNQQHIQHYEREQVKPIYRNLGLDFRVRQFSLKPTPDAPWLCRKSDQPSRWVFRHLRGEAVLSLPRMPVSNLLHVDIDCKQREPARVQATVQEIVNYLGEPALIEHSISSGGYHLLYRLDLALKSRHISKIQGTLTGLPTPIELLYGKKNLRLPFSYSYRDYGPYDSKQRNLVHSITIFEALNSLTETWTISLPDDLKIIVDEVEAEIRFPVRSGGLRSQETASRFLNAVIRNHTYGPGERNRKQLYLAWLLKTKGYDFETFVQVCYACDRGSEGMKQESQAVQRVLKAIWKGCNAIPTACTRSEDIPDSPKLLSDRIPRTEHYLTDDERWPVATMIDDLSELRSEKPRADFVEGCIWLLEYILGMMEYAQVHQMSYDPPFDFLNPGVPLSKSALTQIAREQGIKNPDRVKSFLLKWGFLKEMVNPVTKMSFSYKGKYHYSKHYMVPDLLPHLEEIWQRLEDENVRMECESNPVA